MKAKHEGKNPMIPSRKQKPKGARRMKSSDYDLLVESISSLADSLMAIYRQSYDALLPIVDDICQRKESVTQNELEHCFDYLLNISCTDFGKKLFDRVCVTFKSKYPDSVEFYVKENETIYRFTFLARRDDENAKLVAKDPDGEILRVRFYTKDEIYANKDKWRTRLVGKSFDEYFAGKRYPLDLIRSVYP